MGTTGCGTHDTPGTEESEEEPVLNTGVVVIDISDERQVISGFGAANIVQWRPDLEDEDIDKAFGTGPGQLGLSILRLRIPPEPDQFNLNVPTAQKAYNMGVSVIASPWTPPAHMKTSNDIVGVRLLDNAYTEYTDHMKSFADLIAD